MSEVDFEFGAACQCRHRLVQAAKADSTQWARNTGYKINLDRSCDVFHG